MHLSARGLGVLSAVLLGSALTACQPPAVRAVHQFPPSTAATQLAGVKATPELQALVTDLSREGTKGIIEGVTDEQAKRQVAGVVAEVVRVFFDELRASLRLSEQGASSILGGAASSAVRAASDEMGRSLAPAMRAALADLLKDPELRKAIGETSREIGKQAVLGTKEALAEADGRKPTNSILGALQLFSSGTSLFLVLLVSLVFGLPLIWLLRERAAIRRQREDASRRSAVVLALLESAAADDDPRLQKLLRHVAKHLADEPGGADGDISPAPRRVRHA
jgi:hypothetical protein